MPIFVYFRIKEELFLKKGMAPLGRIQFLWVYYLTRSVFRAQDLTYISPCAATTLGKAISLKAVRTF
jgi:hypothetical protein